MVAVSLKKNFFQAEDGIRDSRNVTGVQTCALPISSGESKTEMTGNEKAKLLPTDTGIDRKSVV